MKKMLVFLSLVAVIFYSFGFKAEKKKLEEIVPFPEGYRAWKHIKSGYIGPESIGFTLFGGFHHIYANELAIQGYTKGVFPEGAVLVFDVISAKASQGVIEETSRSVIDVMVKDSLKYAATLGWGFERFKGDNNTERLLDANFRSTCVSCHKKNKDFVFSEYRK
jgi:Cytochrome P460